MRSVEKVQERICSGLIFSEKSLAHGKQVMHTGYEIMRHENKDKTFILSRAQLQALRAIEREKGLSLAVQLYHAHFQWIKAKRKRK